MPVEGDEGDGTGKSKDKGKGREDAPLDRSALWDRYIAALTSREAALTDPLQEDLRGPSVVDVTVAHNDLVNAGLDPNELTDDDRVQFNMRHFGSTGVAVVVPSEGVVSTPESAPPVPVSTPPEPHQPSEPPALHESSEPRESSEPHEPHQPSEPSKPSEQPPEPPEPQLPARIGPNLVLGGSDVVEEFDSGDAVFKHFETVVRKEAGDVAWEENRERITSQFTDLGLRPKVTGMLRGGRPIAHAVDLGFARTLTLDVQLLGASEHSKLTFENIEKDYEFEHTSDPTTVVGSLEDGRDTILVGAQGNLTIAHLNATAGVFGTGALERALRAQRADRQISGAQTVEDAHRFHGNIRAVLSYRKSNSPGHVHQRRGRLQDQGHRTEP